MNITLQNWAQTQPFSSLPSTVLQKLAACSRMVNFSDGQMIFSQGDEDTPVYFVSTGSVRIFRSNPEGRQQTLSYINPGQSFNIPTVFLKDSLAPANAAAFGSSQLIAISRRDFHRLVSESSEIALLVIQELSSRLQHMTNLVHDISLRTVRARLARFILTRARSAPVPTNWTQEQIAAQLGTSREVVSRAFRSLIQDGLITLDRQQIFIPDSGALEMESED